MSRERLERLASLLDTVKPEHFNLTGWYTGRYTATAEFTPDNIQGCGTTACAVGWACTIPEFRNAGLYMTQRNAPAFEALEGYEAVSRFFEIDADKTRWLFSPVPYSIEEYKDPAAVATRIRELLDRGQS